MLEAITNYLSNINDYFAVFMVSMMPIVELRGAIPIGVSMGLNWGLVYLISVVGNLIPVPFIILFLRPILEFMKKTKLFGKFANWVHEHSMKKADNVVKYKVLGLFLFVAIPIPGTGAWTGAAIAALLDLRLKNALPPILLGVLTAGILMMGISYGFGELFTHFFAANI
jgi:uncharacterized membrane protein